MRYLVGVLVLILAACGGSEAASDPTVNPASGLAGPATIETARDVVEALRATGLPVGNMMVWTAETDPNNLLGRPNGYTSKVTFNDTRIADSAPNEWRVDDGGDVEVFPNDADAQARAEYVRSVVKAAPIVTQYVYQTGPVVLRIAAKLTPDQAGAYEVALKGLKV